MGRRAWLAAAGVVVVVGGGVAGGVALHSRGSGTPEPVAVVSAPRPTAVQVDVTAQSAAVDAILKRRATAVLENNEAQFLADVDPKNKLLLAKQKVLFENLVQFGFVKLDYLQDRPQFEQGLLDKYGPTTYLVSVVMSYQIGGIDDGLVKAPLGYMFVQRGGRYLLINDTYLDSSLPFGAHKEAWDVGPVLVRRSARALVVVEQGKAQLAKSILTEAESAVRAVNKLWSASWRGGGLVIALDDRRVRIADYTKPKDAEDFLATATFVYRTLPGEVQSEGTFGGAYVVVNPRYRDELDARVLAHEFTHVATAQYGVDAPVWMVEGTAEYIEQLPMQGERDLDLARYRTMVRSKYFSKLKALPTDEQFYDTVKSSYPVGWYVVDYIVDKYGATKLAKVYKELARQGFSQNQRDLIFTAQLGRTEAQLFKDLQQR
ncbi:hypothetical protein GCM10009554_05360 [Kribbella koreensis]|uniref:Basic secretory peptidase family protein n=1 Tax=Kribbella koreensis TaxID=57909 RepID=A0ABN1PCP4_9ACTN